MRVMSVIYDKLSVNQLTYASGDHSTPHSIISTCPVWHSHQLVARMATVLCLMVRSVSSEVDISILWSVMPWALDSCKDDNVESMVYTRKCFQCVAVVLS